MKDSIIGYDEEMKCPIFMSDVYPFEDYEEIKEGEEDYRYDRYEG